MYGMPQPNSYGQYAFPGFAGFPGQAGAAPGAPGAGSPGMPQANPAGGLGLAGAAQPGGDPNVAGQPGQQWAGADPSGYYANYWGGK